MVRMGMRKRVLVDRDGWISGFGLEGLDGVWLEGNGMIRWYCWLYKFHWSHWYNRPSLLKTFVSVGVR